MITILIVLHLTSYCFATVYIDGPCPKITPVKDFNLTSYTQGTWYELARYPDDWENNDDCPYIQFGANKKFSISGVYKNRPNVVNGIVDFTKDAGGDGILNFQSASFEGAVESKSNDLPVYFLFIDYDKFLIAYECKYDEKKNVRHEFAWIDARTKELDSESKKQLDDFLSKTSVINAKYFVWEHFSDEFCKM